MECPFCDFPLVAVLSFSDEEVKLLDHLPYVIAYPLERMLQEEDGLSIHSLEHTLHLRLDPAVGAQVAELLMAAMPDQPPLTKTEAQHMFPNAFQERIWQKLRKAGLLLI